MFSILKKYIIDSKIKIVLFITGSIILCTVKLINPYLFGKYIDALISNGGYSNIYKFTILLIGLMVLETSFSYLIGVLSMKLKASISFKLNYDILDYVKRAQIKYLKKHDPVYLSERINLDSNIVTNFVIENVFNLIVNVVSLITIFYVLLIINYHISIIIIINLFIYIVIYTVLRRALKSAIYKLKESQNNYSAKLTQQLAFIKVIKLNCWYMEFSKRLKEEFSKLYGNILTYTRISSLYSCSDIGINRLFNVILIFYGGVQIVNNKLTVGGLTIISNYYSVVLGAFGVIYNFGKLYEEAQVSYRRIKEIYDYNPDNNGEICLNEITSVQVRGLTFSYDNVQLFTNFNYEFRQDNIYLVSGRNGSGKSTFLNLLLGLTSDYMGDIKYNSTDIRSLDMEYIRKKCISVCEQECMLLNDSILHNITIDNTNYNDLQLENLMDLFNIKDFIHALPDKENTMLNDRANNISGGERQKICLIRSVLKQADLLIFDEPTSSMDIKSVAKFKDLLLEIKKGKIIIIVTHDKNLLDITDNIINLEML